MSEPNERDAVYAALRAAAAKSEHPERYILGKPHPDRAKQFKPFAALRGYTDIIAEEVEALGRDDAIGPRSEGPEPMDWE